MKADAIMDLPQQLCGVHVHPLDAVSDFLSLAGRFAAAEGTVLLMSGGDLDCARYHILAADPWLRFKGRGRRMTLETTSGMETFEADPFDTLAGLAARFSLDAVPGGLPVEAGLFGYLSYDLKDHLEKLPRTSVDFLGLPQICFYAPRVLVVHDTVENKTRLCLPVFQGDSRADMARRVDETLARFAAPLHRGGEFSGDPDGFASNFSKPEYMAAIRAIRAYITEGHVYQVNMSQRFEMDFTGDAFSLFRHLYADNPAPFFAYIHAGDHCIVSTSPERFLLQQGREVETRPIKGTRPRGATAAEDAANREELQQSPKDDAELSMIVDLLRNDLGRVCRGGTVRVTEHKRLEAYTNVYHLVSIVKGTLAENASSVDLIRATFPGGSITGCPKIRAMEIIDELEPTRRHIYTGSIGYLGFHDTMDLSIAIRTATVYNGRILFSAGGGIVFDSDPADEYAETLHKGQTLMRAFGGEGRDAPARHVWINGALRPAGAASVPLTDLGVQYGFGFFETIRAVDGVPLQLAAHIRRFNNAWEALFGRIPPDLTWPDIIASVLARNALDRTVAAVKIMATRGSREMPPYDHTLVVTARPYVHRLEGLGKTSLDLKTYPEPRRTPLAAFKTLNYLYYYLAGQWAKARGGDEALILNPDGSVSETNTANLLLLNGNTLTRPTSAAVLPGVMAQALCDLARDFGYGVDTRVVTVADLYDAECVLLTNALMGVVPATSLDGRSLGVDSGFCGRMNRALLEAGS